VKRGIFPICGENRYLEFHRFTFILLNLKVDQSLFVDTELSVVFIRTFVLSCPSKGIIVSYVAGKVNPLFFTCRSETPHLTLLVDTVIQRQMRINSLVIQDPDSSNPKPPLGPLVCG